MSSEEFWHGDLKLAVAYREAEKIRRENRYLAEWRSGIYVREALLSASPAFREFSKGIEAAYPEQPLFTTRDAIDVEEEKNRREMLKMRARFEEMAKVFNQKFAKQQESQQGE